MCTYISYASVASSIDLLCSTSPFLTGIFLTSPGSSQTKIALRPLDPVKSFFFCAGARRASMHSVGRTLLQLGPGARCCVSTEFAVMLLRCWQQTSYLNRFAQIQAGFEASSQRGQLVMLQTRVLSVSPVAKAQQDQRSKLRYNEKHSKPEKNWTRKQVSNKFDVRFT